MNTMVFSLLKKPNRVLDFRWACIFAIVFLASCSMGTQNIVPEELSETATPVGFNNVRFFGDGLPQNARQVVKRKIDDSIAARPNEWNRNRIIDVNFLIISGGGPDGAFGAGILNGMTDGGKRIDFEVVTGVSTGALIAPFAFLGPKYDAALKSVYTEIGTKDIVRNNGALLALSKGSLGDTAPLQAVIARYVTPELLSDVAHEYKIGRRLFVGTTNINAQRPVIWNMGEIAKQGDEKALKLFRKVLLASTAIPVAFPSVKFQVEANNQIYEEVHIDGGTTNNAFFLPVRVGLAAYLKQLGLRIRPTMYVIRNSKSNPVWEPVEKKLLKVAQRSIATLVKNSTTGDLYRLFTFTTQNNIDFRMIDIPNSFNVASKEPFDPVYMSQLYDVGYQFGKNGVQWKLQPPGL